MNLKQKAFEKAFENSMDFTPGDQLDSKYKDPHTEDRWKTWSACWDSIVCRFNKKLEAAQAALGTT